MSIADEIAALRAALVDPTWEAYWTLKMGEACSREPRALTCGGDRYRRYGCGRPIAANEPAYMPYGGGNSYQFLRRRTDLQCRECAGFQDGQRGWHLPKLCENCGRQIVVHRDWYGRIFCDSYCQQAHYSHIQGERREQRTAAEHAGRVCMVCGD